VAAPGRSEWRNSSELVVVGVALLRDSIDKADPGRGLGLGLGGASLSLAQSLSSPFATPKADSLPLSAKSVESPSHPKLVPVDSAAYAWAKSSGSGACCIANRSVLVLDFAVEPSALWRGVRPAAITFFRALSPMQLTSCCMASRSETVRRGAVRVRRSVLGYGMAPKPTLRIGVANWVTAARGVGKAEAWYERAGSRAAGVVGASSNASAVGPHENPMKNDSASPRRME